MSSCLIVDPQVLSLDYKSFKALNPSFLELRVDHLKTHDVENLELILKKIKKFKIPLIGTIRDPREGGRVRFSPEYKNLLFDTLMTHCDLIDIELKNAPKLKSVIQKIKKSQLKLILSYHHFKSCPSLKILQSLLTQGMTFSPNYIKFAVTVNDAKSFLRLCAFTHQHQNKPVITMGMGKFGPVSRVLMPHLGSKWTYTFLSQANAPGQLNIHDLNKISHELNLDVSKSDHRI